MDVPSMLNPSSVDFYTQSFLTLSYASTMSVCVIITERKPGKSKIWCINNENVLNKDMDYHGIFLGLYYTQYD